MFIWILHSSTVSLQGIKYEDFGELLLGTGMARDTQMDNHLA